MPLQMGGKETTQWNAMKLNWWIDLSIERMRYARDLGAFYSSTSKHIRTEAYASQRINQK